MKKVLAIFFAILSLSLILISCGDDEKESKYNENYVYDGTSLVGKWQESVQNDEFYQVYDISEDKIILTSYSFGIMMQEITATYHVEDNNTLVVAWGDGYVDRNKFSITNDKTVVITQVIASSTSEMELVPYNLEWNIHWSTTRSGLCGCTLSATLSSVNTHIPRLVINVSIP